MSDHIQEKQIVITDLFDLNKIRDLFVEYVNPFSHITSSSDLISPRRLLGNYLTYLVVDNHETFSVMVKNDKTKIGLQCTCNHFQRDDKCPHIALVLVSMEKQITEEIIEKDFQSKALEKLIQSKSEVEALSKEKEAKIDSQQKSIMQSKTETENILVNLELKNSPFVIQNAKDFSLYRLSSIIPELRAASRRGKEFIKLSTKISGIEVLYKNKRVQTTVSFVVNEEDDLEITCLCKETYKNNVCSHAVDCIYFLADTGSFSQFVSFTNQDREKNRLLVDYGLTIDDSEAADFKFVSDYTGRLSLGYIPPQFISISKIGSFNTLIVKEKKLKRNLRFVDESHRIGIYFQFTNKNFTNNPLKIEAIKIENGKKDNEKWSRILIGKEENTPLLAVMEEHKYQVLMDFSFLEFKDFIGTGYYAQSYSIFNSQHYDGTRKLYLKYFINKLEEHWQELSSWNDIKYLPEGENFAKSSLKNLQLVKEHVYPKIHVSNNEKFIIIRANFVDGDGNILVDSTGEYTIYRGKFILQDENLYLIKGDDLVGFLTSMPNGVLYFPITSMEKVMKNILHPLHIHHGVELPGTLTLKVKEVPMVPAIHLKEFQDKFLLIAPKFHYEDIEVEMQDKSDYYFQQEEDSPLLLRNTEEEDGFAEYIKSTHPHFRLQNTLSYFLLPFEDVMKQQWFINFSKKMMSEGIKMIGFHDLKRFKYNTATPKWDTKVSSEIDWFDVKVTATWGDQVIEFRDIRKAIMNGQSFVVLGDGSFGMMPEDWLKKYSSLFKFGVDNQDGLKISKKQFNIIEMLFDQIDDESIIEEIEEKKRKLLHIEDVQTKPIPTNINATLRPYQETGYQWMQVLDEISWGGCLADDMGLGKTLQTITFLSYLKDKYGSPTSLIICPTSLIYNWESELKKFAPELKYHIFYGLARTFTAEHFEDYDIIISSYGIVRNDIQSLIKFKWEYVILDESQAIKNPDAISTKAVSLLQARNKFILSGTPLQNNTFDIYAQFNFLNPGMLGGREFFRQEFANPIDKNGDKEAGLMLRRLIKPFMLRRTKNEVATDLPEKTETILWCEMDKNQKKLYDEYKDYYRLALMQKIETEGMGKSGVYILEGLLRLRQICDDPRLVKDKDTKPFKGVKIKELVREIQENMGSHKMLVFSQFTEMLALIREEMDENKIKYCYLDGSTPATQRREQVDIFQNQGDINVFLISLKAGGVGLNLTEADYVYIVDPWWNPAVEQQAIDRTHRIGQKNKIFAYKMICKDSVEEKIILLQEKKMSVSKEIVQEDTAFFKSLSKDDISFLFS